MSAPTEPGTYALLTDGTTIEIRPARPDDFEAVRDMHARMSPENLYMRFFGISRVAAEQEARRVCREPAPDRAALPGHPGRPGHRLQQLSGDRRRVAEIGMAVADDMHRRGIGTLLLEHMISLARSQGVRTFAAADPGHAGALALSRGSGAASPWARTTRTGEIRSETAPPRWSRSAQAWRGARSTACS